MVTDEAVPRRCEEADGVFSGGVLRGLSVLLVFREKNENGFLDRRLGGEVERCDSLVPVFGRSSVCSCGDIGCDKGNVPGVGSAVPSFLLAWYSIL